MTKDQAIVPQSDPEMDALRQKATERQAQIQNLSNRLSTMEQMIQDFQEAQALALGDVLAECLGLRLEYLRRKAAQSGDAQDIEAARQAADEHASYHSVWDDPGPSLTSLGQEEQEELKKIYRAAAMLCHPDRVSDENKAQSHDVFLELQNAYRQGNRLELQRLLAQLSGAAVAEQPDSSCDKTEFKKFVSRLGDQAVDLILAIQTMQLSETFREAAHIDDWQEGFDEARQGFEEECAALRQMISVLEG